MLQETNIIDERTGIELNAKVDQTVIEGTFRPEDLLPVFLDVLKNTPECTELNKLIPTYAWEDDDAEYWESDECMLLINEDVFDILNQYAPEGYFFGSHPGNGSDFGFWKNEEEEF